MIKLKTIALGEAGGGGVEGGVTMQSMKQRKEQTF